MENEELKYIKQKSEESINHSFDVMIKEKWYWRLSKAYYSFIHYSKLAFKKIPVIMKFVKDRLILFSVLLVAMISMINHKYILDVFTDPVISTELIKSWQSEVSVKCGNGGYRSKVVLRKYSEILLTKESGYEKIVIEHENIKDITYCG